MRRVHGNAVRPHISTVKLACVYTYIAEEIEAAKYGERMEKQYGLELDYRIFTGAAHLFFNSITQAPNLNPQPSSANPKP